jgi:hypothetical protein
LDQRRVTRSGFVPGQLYYTYLSMAAAFSIPAASTKFIYIFQWVIL